MDLFNKICANKLGIKGIVCHCCDNGFSKKRKSKRKNLWSKMRRTRLKMHDYKMMSVFNKKTNG